MFVDLARCFCVCDFGFLCCVWGSLFNSVAYYNVVSVIGLNGVYAVMLLL